MSAGVQICMPLQDRSYRVHSLGNTISCFRSASSCFSLKKLHHHMQSFFCGVKIQLCTCKKLEQQMEQWLIVQCLYHAFIFFFFFLWNYAYSIGYIIAYAKQKCTLIIIAKYNNVYIYIYIGNK